MTQVIHSRRVISITEFRKNPIESVNSGDGALAIMSRNQPAFYCVLPEEYGQLLALAEQAKKAQTS
ncbi:antitoxin of toxin-antitoxin stability system [Escherichia coli]|uniref:antitoxin of toxin-antitoxin stability system n=1 Tax=Atlantibacter hermannii TaxID=565 RepID=UPI001D5DE8A5|nr:antitoxin of toxin-antitoxin stability system [Atlantibacter hermannii]EET2715029.1 antitoxin of toxin-antitoxin stability system [Escherichia coli]